jgi:hypothetical protein
MRDQDIVSELERLADLRDRGAVTKMEFEAQKRALLGGAARLGPSRWTDPVTLLPMAISLVALGLATYALVGSGAAPATAPLARTSTAGQAASGASPAAALPAVGDTGRIKTATMACFDLQDYQKAQALAASDRSAADKFAEQACGAFEAGTAVAVDRVSASDAAVCARQADRGSNCFWVAVAAFGK